MFVKAMKQKLRDSNNTVWIRAWGMNACEKAKLKLFEKVWFKG